MVRIPALVFLASLASSAVGASVPVSQRDVVYTLPAEDGVYTGTFEADGTFRATRLGDVPAVSNDTSDDPAAVVKRQLGTVTGHGCHGASSNRAEWDGAAEGFANACDWDHKIPANGVLYVRTGTHAAYGCSFGGVNPCSRGEYWAALGFLNDRCGRYIGGYVSIGAWKKEYGMQQRAVKETICGHAINWG